MPRYRNKEKEARNLLTPEGTVRVPGGEAFEPPEGIDVSGIPWLEEVEEQAPRRRTRGAAEE